MLFMLIVSNMLFKLSVVMVNVIMLSVVMVNVIMLSVVMVNVIMLSVVMLNVVMLSVVAPFDIHLTSLKNKILLNRFYDKFIAQTGQFNG